MKASNNADCYHLSEIGVSDHYRCGEYIPLNDGSCEFLKCNEYEDASCALPSFQTTGKTEAQGEAFNGYIGSTKCEHNTKVSCKD